MDMPIVRNTCFFSNTLVIKVGAAYFISNETIHISLKNQILGPRRSYGYTYQSPSIPTHEMENSWFGLNHLVIYLMLSRHRGHTLNVLRAFDMQSCKVVLIQSGK